MDWIGYSLLFAVGVVAGLVNVLAGGGSFLTLPILMFLGLPPGVANGTNRVGILLQNVGAVWSFDRHRVLERSSLWWAAAPACLGAAVGVWLALWISDEAFKKVLAILMVTMAIGSIWSPARRSGMSPAAPLSSGWSTAALVGTFLLIGIYGGFVQAGVGFLILATTSAAGLDLVRGNAVKVLTVLCFTVLALLIFAWNGKVDWWSGILLASGMVLGGLAGARLTVVKGHRWVRGVVTITIVLFALRLWMSQ